MTQDITITDPRDLALLRIAQGALFRNTIFPSGWKSPDEDMRAVGDKLSAVRGQA